MKYITAILLGLAFYVVAHIGHKVIRIFIRWRRLANCKTNGDIFKLLGDAATEDEMDRIIETCINNESAIKNDPLIKEVMLRYLTN